MTQHTAHSTQQRLYKSAILFSMFIFILSSCTNQAGSDINEEEIITKKRSLVSISEFETFAENNLNKTYAKPAGQHDEYQLESSDFLVDIEPDGSMLTKSVDDGLELALDKIECQFYCNSLPNKSPLFFDVEILNADNGDGTATLEISTGIGNELANPTVLPLKEFLPGEEYNASGVNLCNVIEGLEPDLGAAPKIASYITYNKLINSTISVDEYYDNISNYFYNGSIFPGTPWYLPGGDYGWNDGYPNDFSEDFISFKFMCDDYDYPSCNLYFYSDGTYKNLFHEVLCLNDTELNTHLGKETGVVTACAADQNKDFLFFSSNYELTASGKRFWNGTQKNGKKKSRIGFSVLNLNSPTNGCSCN